MTARPPHIRVVLPLSSGVPADWQPEVAERVKQYQGRKRDLRWRQEHGLEPQARERGGAARSSGGWQSPRLPVSGLSLHPGRAALVCSALAVITVLAWAADVSLKTAAFTLLALSIGLGFTALLFDYLEGRR